MLGFITKLFGSKKEKDVKELRPYMEKTNLRYAELKTLSDDELRAETQRLKEKIKAAVAPYVEAMNERQERIRAAIQDRTITEKKELFAEVEKIKADRNKAYEIVLLEVLPEAFAVVKETCRRLVENGELRVKATDWDRELAAKKSNVVIEGETAVWKNTWLVTGTPITWDMIHYDVQLIGGAALHQGKIAEMATGEGKTLVSTLPAYLNALTGEGVHVVTVNDYLARRDSQWNGPIFEFHGLRVDCIDIHQPNSEARRNAYRADIVYGTNNEFGFDYLRDNMVSHPEMLVQRDHHYAIIDEIDSVLIDEARTPLIISGPVPQGDRHEFAELRPRIEKLIQTQSAEITKYLSKVRELMKKENDKEAKKELGVLLLRCHRALPKFKPLIKILSEPGMKQELLKTEAYYLQDASRNMHLIDDELYFVIDEKNNTIELTDKGRDLITKSSEDPELFVLPDIAAQLATLDTEKNLTDEERLRKKDELLRNFSEKSERLHSISQLLKAYALFEKDVDYIVADGKVMIVDENTGRVLAGRRYSDGLHQAIEAKENVKIEDATQTFATVTLQNYFRMYHKLSGMTGTAETEAAEFYQIYKLDVVSIPTNKPVIRQDLNDLVYKTKREKYAAIIDEIQKLSEAGRPVLVGTSSVETSELLSRALTMRKIPHNVLNAKQHQREAEIIANAGLKGQVTIATNMAGRGTDIKLGPGVREAGGLAIIGSERHDSRRIDRQLRGRAGRQGDPGSSRFFVSLEDDLMRMFGSERIAKLMDRLKMPDNEPIESRIVTNSITNAQKKVEENNFAIRKRLLEYDDVMNLQREAVYKRRRNALFGEQIKIDLDQTLLDLCRNIAERHYREADIEAMRMEAMRIFAIDPGFTDTDLDKNTAQDLGDKIYQLAKEAYRRKEQRIAEPLYETVQRIKQEAKQYTHILLEFTDGTRTAQIHAPIDEIIESKGYAALGFVEKAVTLEVIDEAWQNHLREMDELKHSVQTASYEQKDPLLIYKFEAFELFQQMLLDVNTKIMSQLFRFDLKGAEETQRAAAAPRRDPFAQMRASHSNEPLPPEGRVIRKRAAIPVPSKNNVSATPIPTFDDDVFDPEAPENVAPADKKQPERFLSRKERRLLERTKSKR